ncbi:DMT family transporter [Candidatus Parcubacteria bacterium]|nr:MAG: DMT family transporter [Candidatus Parcubacteria bacterium]
MWFWLSLFFALGTSVSGIVTKKAIKNISPLSFFLLVNLLVVPIVAVIVLFLGGVPQIEPTFYLFMTISAVLDIAAFLAVLKSIKTSPISLVTPFSAFNPVFTMGIAAFALGEIPTPIRGLGVLVIVLGLYLLDISEVKKGIFAPFKNILSHRGVQLYLLANLIWAITPIFQKKSMSLINPSMPLFVAFFGDLIITLLIIPFALPILRRENRVVRDEFGWFLIIAFFAVLGRWLSFTAFSLTNVGYATAVFKISPIFTILLGAIIFKETNIKERLVGASIMILGTILLVV